MQKCISKRELKRRIRAGMRYAKASGIRLGRPPKVTAHDMENIAAMYDSGQTIRQIASATGFSLNTVHRFIRR